MHVGRNLPSMDTKTARQGRIEFEYSCIGRDGQEDMRGVAGHAAIKTSNISLFPRHHG